MAGEWIKIEASTVDKPEVLKIARILKIDRDAVFGKLARLWMWFDANSVDGVVDGVVDADIDRICYCDGFASACVAVGWLRCDDEAEQVSLPNFERHNGETAKQRAMKNRRQSKWRESVDGKPSTKTTQRVDTAASTKASTREEKRREEEKNPLNPPADAGGKSPKSKRTSRIGYPAFIEACRENGERPILPDDPIFKFAEDTQIPVEFIALAWRAFSAKHRDSRKQQAGVIGWRAQFRDAVRGNWGKLWYFPGEGVPAALTTVGIALSRERDADSARRSEQGGAA